MKVLYMITLGGWTSHWEDKGEPAQYIDTHKANRGSADSWGNKTELNQMTEKGKAHGTNKYQVPGKHKHTNEFNIGELSQEERTRNTEGRMEFIQPGTKNSRLSSMTTAWRLPKTAGM